MSLIPPVNTQANDVFQVGFWLMAVGGTLSLGWTLPALRTNINGAFTPLLVVEGVGLTLVGISQLMTYQSKDSRTQDKLRASGLTFLGLGIGALGIADAMTSDKIIPLAFSGITLTTGALCVGLADDKANLVKWKD